MTMACHLPLFFMFALALTPLLVASVPTTSVHRSSYTHSPYQTGFLHKPRDVIDKAPAEPITDPALVRRTLMTYMKSEWGLSDKDLTPELVQHVWDAVHPEMPHMPGEACAVPPYALMADFDNAKRLSGIVGGGAYGPISCPIAANFLTDVQSSAWKKTPFTPHRHLLPKLISKDEAEQLRALLTHDIERQGELGGHLILESHPVLANISARVRERVTLDVPLYRDTAELLAYPKGRWLMGHSDNSQWSAQHGIRVPQPWMFRAYTLVVGLTPTADYDGGELRFTTPPVQKLKLDQTDAILFRSTAENIHEVLQITRGLRSVFTVFFHSQPFGERSTLGEEYRNLQAETEGSGSVFMNHFADMLRKGTAPVMAPAPVGPTEVVVRQSLVSSYQSQKAH